MLIMFSIANRLHHGCRFSWLSRVIWSQFICKLGMVYL